MNRYKKYIKKVRNEFKFYFEKDIILLKWSQNKETFNNWGDALNPYLISFLTNKSILNINDIVNFPTKTYYTAIGSVLDNLKQPKAEIWGSGFKKERIDLEVKPQNVWAVRGRYTKKELEKQNIKCPDIFGDPAILISDFYKPANASKTKKLGIIPHYIDKPSAVLKKFQGFDEVIVIDILQDIEKFIDKVCECDFIASSSLHGLICAAAYNIPYVWLKISNQIVGNNFKFYDYYSSFLNEDKIPTPFVIDEKTTLKSILKRDNYISEGPLKEPLYKSCPFLD